MKKPVVNLGLSLLIIAWNLWVLLDAHGGMFSVDTFNIINFDNILEWVQHYMY